MKTKKLFLLVVLLTLALSLLSPQVTAQAATTYNRDAAVQWAISNNRNDRKAYGASEGRWCTTYITKALQAGGLPGIPVISSNPALATWLRNHPSYWEIRPLNQLEKGDFIFLNNRGSFNLNSPYIAHIILVTGPNQSASWNVERLNTSFSAWAVNYPYQLGIHILGVAQSTYSSSWVRQSPYPTVTQGGYADLWVTYKNTGTATWFNTYSPNRTHLGTLNPTTGAVDYVSPFVGSSWIGNNRPAVLSESSVTPGNNGTFRFRIYVPSNLAPGVHRIAVAPLVESVSWMKSPQFVYWDVTVRTSGSGNLAVKKTAYATSQDAGLAPWMAIDGRINYLSRWSSQNNSTIGPQWWMLDLNSMQSINQIIVRWEYAYARDYFVGYSAGPNCRSTTYHGWNYYPTSRRDNTINFSTLAARCVGIYMRQRAPGMTNYSIYEVEVYRR
jgi:hypothetical protein